MRWTVWSGGYQTNQHPADATLYPQPCRCQSSSPMQLRSHGPVTLNADHAIMISFRQQGRAPAHRAQRSSRYKDEELFTRISWPCQRTLRMRRIQTRTWLSSFVVFWSIARLRLLKLISKLGAGNAHASLAAYGRSLLCHRCEYW